MLADLRTHGQSLDEHAFPDRLPYVLDLFAGVRRQINEYRPASDAFRAWWAAQNTPERDAITNMRHAELKSYRRTVARAALSQTFVSAGYFNGRPINSGDTVVVFLGWRFAGGHFDGRDVLEVLDNELGDMRTLITRAEVRLEQEG